MAKGNFISYLRVSTQKQGISGLGLDAQREAVASYLNGGNWKLVKEVVEIETGKRNDRPALGEALRLCKLHRATLIVAKLDRLARNAEFLKTIVRESGERGVVFADLSHIPEGPTGKFLIGMMAEVAELEAGMISQRTKAALAAAKARGRKLGGRRVSRERWQEIGEGAVVVARQAQMKNAAQGRALVLPVIRELQASGATSLREIAAGLNEQGIEAPRGGEWSAVQVKRVLDQAVVTEVA
jgi:DNA invertase Pin-like site-specific DNA recombinase